MISYLLNIFFKVHSLNKKDLLRNQLVLSGVCIGRSNFDLKIRKKHIFMPEN